MTYGLALCDGFDHYAVADWGWKWRRRVGTHTLVPGPYHGSGVRFAGGGNYLDSGRGGFHASRAGMANLYLHSATWGAAEHVCPLQLVRRTPGTGGDPDDYAVKQSLWIHADGSLSVRLGEDEGLLVASAAGVFGFDRWTHVCYASGLSLDDDGRVDVYVDGVEVASVTGLATCGELPSSSSDMRLGNCLPDGNTVTLDADDYAAFLRFDASGPDPNPPDQVGPHAIATTYPVEAGDETEFPAPAGAAATGEHWEASAEAVADGEGSYVEKPLLANPADLYRVGAYGTALPALPESSTGLEARQFRSVLSALLAPSDGGNGFANVITRYRDEFGEWQDTQHRQNLGAALGATWPTEWRFRAVTLNTSRSGQQTMQVGYGGSVDTDAPEQAFRGSQLAVELWYPAPGPPAVPAAGGQKWSAGWVG